MRKGQELFNFLEWLRTKKGRESTESHRMADPYNIPDYQWEELKKEYDEKNNH